MNMRNIVEFGDCLTIMENLPACTFDLIYADPPFFTGKEQRLRGRKQWKGEPLAFDDIWATQSEYLSWMKERLLAIYRLLKPTGSLVLHCDWHANHLLRIELDEIFSPENFRSEIIWAYRRWSNVVRTFQRSHDTLLFYSKSNAYNFNTIYEDYSFTTNIDQIWQKRGRAEDGRAITISDINGAYVPLVNDKPGVPLRDVWDIPYLNPKAKERVGYPTQKPLELITRIILALSEPGHFVLDPFCGSGTTLVASKILGRDYFGIDISPQAVEISKERLAISQAGDVTKHHEPYTFAKFLQLYRSEKLKAIGQFLPINIVHRNKYIDAFLKKSLEGPVPILYIGDEASEHDIEGFICACKKRMAKYAVIITDRLKPKDAELSRFLTSFDLQVLVVSYEQLGSGNFVLEDGINVRQLAFSIR